MKLKSKKIRSMEEIIKIEEKLGVPGVIGKSFLAAGGIPKRKNKKNKNNRIIKFRVWDSVGDRWMDIFEVNLLDSGYLNNPEYILQQFTGLLDKNNKEIYDGDIVKYDGKCDITYLKPGIVSIGECIYDRGFYYYGVRIKRLDMKNCYFGIGLRDKDYLIIGNIFENPELLNK